MKIKTFLTIFGGLSILLLFYSLFHRKKKHEQVGIIEIDTYYLTIDHNRALYLLGQIEIATNGWGHTDEQMLYDIFYPLNHEDYKLLYKLYGIRKGKDLTSILKSEISPIWDAKLYSYIKTLVLNAHLIW